MNDPLNNTADVGGFSWRQIMPMEVDGVRSAAWLLPQQ